MKLTAIREKQTATQIITDIAENTGLSKKDVKLVLEGLKIQMERNIKPRSVGEFTIPGLGVKLYKHKRPPTKARMGRNPRTGEEVKIAAKPAKTVLKARLLKTAKDMAG
jgi:nucleoid DNA-binding protein